MSLVCRQTVLRCLLKRSAMERTLSPLAFAVRIASTSAGVGGFLDGLLGSVTTSKSSSRWDAPLSRMPILAWFHSVSSRSIRCCTFGLSPAGGTISAVPLPHEAAAGSLRRRRGHSDTHEAEAHRADRERPGAESRDCPRPRAMSSTTTGALDVTTPIANLPTIDTEPARRR